MPQIVMPILAEGMIDINSSLAYYQKKEGRVYLASSDRPTTIYLVPRF